MNDSMASNDERQVQTKSLYQQINLITPNQWKDDDFLFRPFEADNDQENTQPQIGAFQFKLPLQAKIIQQQVSFHEQPKYNIQQNNSLLVQQQKESQVASQIQSQNKIPSQLTITLNQESILSKFFKQVDTEDSSNYSTSIKSFLHLNQKSYRPHVTALKTLYNNLRQFSIKSLSNLSMYISFLELKMRQQIESLKLYDEQKSADYLHKQQIQALDQQLYIDERAVLYRIKYQQKQNSQKIQVFYAGIKNIYDKMLSLWRKIKEKREKKERSIDEDAIRIIDRIEIEMEDIIKCRLRNEKQKVEDKFIPSKIRSHNQYVTKDKYLQIKYLMQRENVYLELINNFGNKLVAYLINIFSKQQIMIYKTVKQSILQYGQIYMECYDCDNEILIKQLDANEHIHGEMVIRNQLTEVLLAFLQKQLYNQASLSPSNDKLESLISNFNHKLQNTIFLTTIEMNHEYILFRNQAIWKTTTNFVQHQENSIDYESKQVLAQQKSLRNAINSINQSDQKENIKIVVVLTSNYYLHLEKQDKVATLRLGDIKLSKRGRQIIISEKAKGLNNIFSNKKQLGRLEFQGTEQVQIFAQKLSQALRKVI